MRGRRRGPPRRAPKDIFSPGAKKEQKKPTPQPPPKVQPIAPPVAVQPPKVAGSEKKKMFEQKVVKIKETLSLFSSLRNNRSFRPLWVVSV